MSAVAIQFDPTFSMGPRSTFAWPGTYDSTSTMLGQDFSSILHPMIESSVSPPNVPRTLASSPRNIFTPEQRDLKKQRDRARRESRASVRMNRASSNSLMGSPPLMHRTSNSSLMGSPPMSMSDVTSAMTMPIYTTAPSSVSVISEPASSLAGSPYLPPYSPPMQDQAFGSPYQQPLQPNYSMSMEYPTTYGTPNEYSLAPTSIPPVGHDNTMMYPMSTVMPTSGSTSASTSISGNNTHNGTQEGNSHVRVVQSRPKPRCFDHGCGGRQFSTFSNLLRHQREKSGQAAKATCPNCGAEFTRTTARNGHLLHDKCKQRRNN